MCWSSSRRRSSSGSMIRVRWFKVKHKARAAVSAASRSSGKFGSMALAMEPNFPEDLEAALTAARALCLTLNHLTLIIDPELLRRRELLQHIKYLEDIQQARAGKRYAEQ